MFPRAVRRCRRSVLAAMWVAGGCLAACAPHSAAVPTPTGRVADGCLVAGGTPRREDTVVVAFADSAAARRALFRQRFASPVRLDCDGRVRPDLAAAWSRDSSGGFWTLSLRDGADAAALTSAWRGRAPALRRAGIASVVPLDDRRVVVGFARPSPTVPDALADTALAIPREPAPRRIVIAAPPADDPRDQLDREVDAVETDDPAVLDYAGRRADRTIVPLPWSRSYLLLLPAPWPAFDSVIGTDSEGFRQALARDAVHADARGAAGPFWWDAARDCGPPGAPWPARRSASVVYPRGERTARALAERIVALAAEPGVAARGLDTVALAAALRSGSERAYVLPVSRRELMPCRETANWPAGVAVVPLVDTRASLILRPTAPAVTVDYDGTLRAPDDGP